MKYKKGSEKKIDKVLENIFSKNDKLSRNYREFDIDKIWRTCFGETISKYTKEVKLYKETLTVYIDSAPMKAELMYRKEKILSQINQELGYYKIKILVIK